MARSSFRRFLLVGGALAAAAAGAYIKRDRVRELLPGSSSAPEPTTPPAPPQPSNYDAPGPPANTATPVPAPDAVVIPDPGRADPGEAFPIAADDPQAVEAAIDAAAADAAASGFGSVDEAGLQGAPEPVDEAAEEQAAAAEAAAIGGPAPEYAGSQLDEPVTEADRPLMEAGEGVSEGQEQAEADLEENATVPDDEGMSDAERQIDDAIEAAGNPAVGETPEPVTPTQDQPEAQDDDDISGGDWQTWSGGAVKPQ